MNIYLSLIEIFTIILLISPANCFSDELETGGQLQKAKRKAMRNSLVRFGKRAVMHPLFPFYDGFGALRPSRFNSEVTVPLEDNDVLMEYAGIRDSGLLRPSGGEDPSQPRTVERHFIPPRYNFFRPRRVELGPADNDASQYLTL